MGQSEIWAGVTTFVALVTILCGYGLASKWLCAKTMLIRAEVAERGLQVQVDEASLEQLVAKRTAELELETARLKAEAATASDASLQELRRTLEARVLEALAAAKAAAAAGVAEELLMQQHGKPEQEDLVTAYTHYVQACRQGGLHPLHLGTFADTWSR